LAAPATKKATAALKAAKVDLTSEAPLHGQIRAGLQNLIANGAYPSGSVLPGEQELARHFKVSRITVKRALNDLALAGFVRRMRGRGTIVTGGPAHPVLRGSFNTLLESLRAMGAETQVELLAAEEASAPPQVAELLDLARGAKVERAVRLRKLKGTPFSHLVTYVPLEIAAAYSREQLATTPLLTLLERAGAKATDAEQTLTAVAAPKEIADALQISAGAPLLHITRVMRDAGGRAVQVIEAHYRPDQFQYHIRLSRRQSGKEDVWSDGD
jgi:GntR family transcriptional regulator